MKRLKKNRRILMMIGMLSVATINTGCGQHVSLAENTEQPDMLIIQQDQTEAIEESTKEVTDNTIESTEAETSVEQTETFVETTTVEETTEELETGTPKITPKETQAIYDGIKEDSFLKIRFL